MREESSSRSRSASASPLPMDPCSAQIRLTEEEEIKKIKENECLLLNSQHSTLESSLFASIPPSLPSFSGGAFDTPLQAPFFLNIQKENLSSESAEII